MLIVANGKNINSFPFRNILTQGEKSSESITFVIDRFYNGFDLYLCSFLIKGVNKNNEEAEQGLTFSAISADKLSLEWNISDAFTAADGELRLELRAVMLSESVPQSQVLILKYIIPPIFVRESPNGSNAPVPSSVDQALSSITSAVSGGLSKIQALIDSFDISAVLLRLDNMDASLAQLLARPRVQPITKAQYDSQSHEPNVLYIIVREEV
ncbi:MAG: hypothetical protein LKG21_07035 [Ruminococcus sp.]|jgi:hypothetical protein|nr:hypothetical protein [Ruminococcus sp.]